MSTTTKDEQDQTEERRDALTLTADNYGPFWKYVSNDRVTDADFNGTDLWITDVDGRRTQITDHGIDDAFVRAFSQRVANKVSKPFNKMAPLLEAETPTLRISVLHESAAVSGRSICLRKSLPNVRISASSILETEYMDRAILNLLVNCIQAKMNFVIGGEPGAGKRLSNDTPVPVPVSERFPTGWAKHGDLVVGDEVYAIDGTITVIDHVTEEAELDLYEVEFSDGQVIEADAEHLWNVSSHRSRRYRIQRLLKNGKVDARYEAEQARLHAMAAELAPLAVSSTAEVLGELVGTSTQSISRVLGQAGVPYTTLPGRGGPRAYAADEAVVAWADSIRESREAGAARRMPETQTLTTAELVEAVRAEGRANWAVPVADAIDGPVQDLPMDPYVLGLWLGDGHSYSGQITSADDFVVEQIVAAGFPIKSSRSMGAALDITFDGLFRTLDNTLERDPAHPSKFAKRIPAIYQRASYEQRLALLQGLMDSDGTVDKVGRSEFCVTNRALAGDALELIRSLGIKATFTEGVAVVTLSDDETDEVTRLECGTRYRIHFTTTQPVFRLPRKVERLPAKVRETQRWNYIVDIRKAPSKRGKCIRIVHPRHLYLAGGFIPTHNTELAKFLTQFIPEDQRVITIEDSPEWHFKEINPGHDCVEMRVSKEFDYSAAIKTCLRQNPKWIALSEARGEEAKWLITSWSTGVNGVTTIHTDDIHKIPARLIAMMNDRNDAERMISDIYDFVNVAILVRRKAMADGTSKRYVDQVGFLYRDGDREDVMQLVRNGEFVSDELPNDIRFRLERAGVTEPFESAEIDAKLGNRFTYGEPAEVAPAVPTAAPVKSEAAAPAQPRATAPAAAAAAPARTARGTAPVRGDRQQSALGARTAQRSDSHGHPARTAGTAGPASIGRPAQRGAAPLGTKGRA